MLWTKSALAPYQYGCWIQDITTDADGNAYLVGTYEGGSLRFEGNINLDSDTSPRSFLAKYDAQGNLVWAQNLEQLSKTTESKPQQVQVQHNKIYVLSTMADDNWISSCEYQKYSFRVDCIGTNSQKIWDKQYTATDMLVAKSLLVTAWGEVIASGYYRGTLNLEKQAITTNKSGSCNVTTSFLIRLDARNGSFIQAITENPNFSNLCQLIPYDNKSFVGLSVEKRENGTYRQGFENPNYLKNRVIISIRQYDHNLNIVQKIELGKDEYPDYETRTRLMKDTEGHLYLSDFYSSRVDTMPNYLRSNRGRHNVFLMRFKFPFKNLPADYVANFADNTNPFLLYPNPITDYLKLRINDLAFQNFTLQVYDVVGHQIGKFESINERFFENFYIGNWAKGVYIFIFQQGEKRFTQKIVKL